MALFFEVSLTYHHPEVIVVGHLNDVSGKNP